MADMFDALIGDQPVDPTALASALRQKQALGTVAALTGISGLQKLGPQMINEAASGAQDYATLRDRTNNQLLQRAIAAAGVQERRDAAAASIEDKKRHDQEWGTVLTAIGAGHDQARLASSSGTGFGSLTPEEIKALDEATASGSINPDKVNARNMKYLAGMALNHPEADLNKLAGEGAQSRNVQTINKSQTLLQIPTILKNVVDAGSALGLSDNKVLGSLELLKAKYSNDPKYTKYMALRNDSLMAIANAMRGQGMSDFATKLEDEAQNPTQSPRALQGWMEGQMEAMGPKAEQARKVLHLPTAGQPAAATPNTSSKTVNFSDLPQ